jgi:hypothetical protein
MARMTEAEADAILAFAHQHKVKAEQVLAMSKRAAIEVDGIKGAAFIKGWFYGAGLVTIVWGFSTWL